MDSDQESEHHQHDLLQQQQQKQQQQQQQQWPTSIGSVYSGNKIRHLKKEDGVPFWRKDIQYDFLKALFDDNRRVFTRYSDGQRNVCFSDIYLDAMAGSSRTSKVLKEKLQNDRLAAVDMAMVCLLVNIGRLNTTVNCIFICLSAYFPE